MHSLLLPTRQHLSQRTAGPNFDLDSLAVSTFSDTWTYRRYFPYYVHVLWHRIVLP